MDFGFSLDDGPSPDTPRLLNVMAAENPPIHGTFFIVGSRAISRPAMVQAEYIQGNQLCAVRLCALCPPSARVRVAFADVDAAHVVAHRPDDANQ